MITPGIKIISPFKFLNSFKKHDSNTYFGRDIESQNLFELYKDSSIMILHGPSGSGKTSLIYCGLLNKIRNNKEVISIRRDDNIINAIKEQLFVIHNDNGQITDDQSSLSDRFFSTHTALKIALKNIHHTEHMMRDLEEDITRFKRDKRRSMVSSQSFSNEKVLSNEEYENLEEKIKKYELRLDKLVVERKQKLTDLKENKEKLSDVSDKIVRFFKNRKGTSVFTPFIIFDQFEELFVYGDKQEINHFGLFLKLIFDHKVPFNVAISLREEYFGYLDQLQSYIPYIFYKKIRLAHPDRNTIKEIITRSFEKFNINQFKNQTSTELSSHEKQERIDLILEQIKIQENGTSGYHLPFLQVYLDSLYKIDFKRTYDRYPTQNDSKKLLPLEFSIDEIKEFGSIENVLENHIREVNTKIIRNPNNTLNNRREHRDTVIKFLRHFKTKDDLKKRIPIQIENDSIIIINNEKLSEKIQKNIWGSINPQLFNPTISEIIEELDNNGILKLSGDYVELSHDIIAKVIGNIRTEDDFRSLIKKDFNSSFNIYEDTNNKEDMLSGAQINRMRHCLDYVLDDDDEERLLRKQKFIEASKEKNVKEEKKRLRLEQKMKRYMLYTALIIGLICSTTILYILLKDSNKENEIKELLGYALREYHVDRTASFNYIQEAEKIQKGRLLSHKKFSLLDDFKKDLYEESHLIPFYHNSIKFEDDFDIITTKTRVSKIHDSLLYIYALSDTNDFIIKEVLYHKKNSQAINVYKKDSTIAFEPFDSRLDTTRLQTLIVEKNGTKIRLRHIVHSNGNKETILSGAPLINKNIIDPDSLSIHIEHQNDYSFLIGIDHKLMRVTIDVHQKKYTTFITDFENESKKKIKRIRSLDNEEYIVLYGSKKLYSNNPKINENINTIISNENQAENQKISTFQVDKEYEKLLIGQEGKIKVLNLENDKNIHDHLVHDREINTIAMSTNEKMLVGSRDNGANLYNQNNVLLKQFIAHKKPLINVSFVKNNTNFIVTSSEDNTIKIWNMTPIAKDPKRGAIFSTDSSFFKFKKEFFLQRLLKKDTTNNLKRKRHVDDMTAIYNSESDTYAVSSSSNNHAIIWEKKKQYEFLQYIDSHSSIITGAKFSGDSLFLTISNDRTIQIYRKKKGEFTQIPSLIRHDYPIEHATFSEKGDAIISLSIGKDSIFKKWKFNSFDSIIKARTYKIPLDSIK